ncbi:putative bifunctional diguanylate cyclase/phosphodiesterase [Novosphingobium sp. B 225]|uniref:putative bifunctional diguanylate cyclase/phosphodiesterase n=1 Tax=Novosphingobium sp. B 225 TaxID=1961849 RepID=UPI0015958F0F|nr:EAL domain-containing protein [Novosphingobium sp. B 225]
MAKPESATAAPRTGNEPPLVKAKRDVIALGIVVASIIMFVGTGSTVLPQVVKALAGHGGGPDMLLTNALLLNIALVIFGWRRYAELTGEVQIRRLAEEQAKILAVTDPLTGCLNRRSIASQTDDLVRQAHAQGESVAMIMLDLDNFKSVNDLHGHAAGDTMLRTAAERIAGQLPERAMLARIGGDEFACVVPFDPAQSAAIDRITANLIAAVSEPVQHGDARVESTISVGLASTEPGTELDSQALMHMADIAMYQAKKRGRNRYCWFDPAMESELRFRSELETGIRRGISLGEFVPFYEKQIDLSTGHLVGFEMLARWRSPTLGSVSPEVFIPVAEEIGAIAELSESLIRQALADARFWHPRLTLSVNISPVQLRDPWFAQKLLKLLVEANFPPSRLEIEITETSLHDNMGLVRSLITSLKNQGVRISLDDFGTGYSSLSQLRSLPFDRIKIDRSFIMTLPDSPDSATIVRSIIAMGEGLGLPVTAEGVETPRVLEALQQFGSLKAQGFLYGMPSSADAVFAELEQLDLVLQPTTEEPAVASETEVPAAPRAKRA